MRIGIFIDDIRNPSDIYENDSEVQDVKWYICRNYGEFSFAMFEYGKEIDVVSFDHDLGNKYTGYDCAVKLVDWCIMNNMPLPKCYVHSANPVGRIRIMSLLKSYLKSVRK